jgi:hypothetical protein
MASLKLVFQSETRKTARVPKTVAELYAKIRELFGIERPYLQYKDDEDDLITIHTDEEYQDALQLSGKGCLRLLISPSTKPIQETSNIIYSAVPSIQPPFSTISTISTATLPIQTHETSCQAAPMPSHKLMEALVKTAESSMNTHQNSDMGISTDFIDLIDATSNTAFYNSKISATDPLATQTQGENTVPIIVDSKGNYANFTAEKASGLADNAKIDSFVQSEGVEQELMESIRMIIRQELESLTGSGNRSVHKGFKCVECGVDPIVGNLFKCAQCDNLVICEICEERMSHPHFFFKYRRPEQYEGQLKPQVPALQDKPIISQPQLTQTPLIQPVISQPIQQPSIIDHFKQMKVEEIPARKDLKQVDQPRPVPSIPSIPSVPSPSPGSVPLGHLNLNDLLSQMESLGFKNKSQNISALIKANCQLSKAISLVELENKTYTQ